MGDPRGTVVGSERGTGCEPVIQRCQRTVKPALRTPCGEEDQLLCCTPKVFSRQISFGRSFIRDGLFKPLLGHEGTRIRNSGCVCVLLLGFVTREIGLICSVQTAFFVDRRVDFGVEKTNPSWTGSYSIPFISLIWRRASSFISASRSTACGLERLQQGEVLLHRTIHALLVERQELELLGLAENQRGSEGIVDVRMVGSVSRIGRCVRGRRGCLRRR